MNRAFQTAAKPTVQTTPVQTGVLQRQCACGGAPAVAGECEQCSRNKLSRQRSTANLGDHTSDRVPPIVHEVLHSAGHPLDAESRGFMEQRFGHDFSKVRVHADSRAAASARAVNALAYTVGQNVVFGEGQFSPRSEPGRRLLAHELAHTVQQGEASLPATEALEVSTPDDYFERQADAVVHSVMSSSDRSANDGGEQQALDVDLAASGIQVARLQRAISFTTEPGAFTTNNVTAHEDATGFNLTSAEPTFEWIPDVTIHGAVGDPFAEWEVAHHQVSKTQWFNAWWGTGADRTHQQRTISGGLPMRDATGTGNTWYSDWRAQPFASDGEVKSPVIRDTPFKSTIPWANPVAGRGGTRGWFNYGFGFVSTLSARHIPDGTGAAAFRHLNHVHWNFMLDGTFDTSQPTPGRVNITGGTVSRSPVIGGLDVDNRPMHGGSIVNDNFSYRNS